LVVVVGERARAGGADGGGDAQTQVGKRRRSALPARADMCGRTCLNMCGRTCLNMCGRAGRAGGAYARCSAGKACPTVRACGFAACGPRMTLISSDFSNCCFFENQFSRVGCEGSCGSCLQQCAPNLCGIFSGSLPSASTSRGKFCGI
jgi:hypothetical protein